MQITNNYEPNFKSLSYSSIAQGSKETIVKDILYNKLPQKEVNSFLNTLHKSPVRVSLGLADGDEYDRLDAMIQYKDQKSGKERFEYIEEKRFFNLFRFKPRKFIHKVLMHVQSLEETFQIGRFAKK